MGKYNGAVITSAGQNVIAQAIAGTELTWTVMRTSSVAIAEGTDLTTLTSLTGIEQTSNITDASVYGDNIVQVSARFSNTGIATVYYIQTVGIYGQLAGGAETLIAVMTAVTPDEMPVYDSDSPSAFIFNTQMTVQNADTVNMTVNDTGTATVADLNRKVDINGGDVSDTVVNTVTASTADYPVPSAGDSVKTIIGKVVKFCSDIVKAFTGATSSAAGKKGLVPAPSAGQQTAYMRGDGTWVQPQNNGTTTAAGYALDARQANPTINGTLAYYAHQFSVDNGAIAARFALNPNDKTISFRIYETASLAYQLYVTDFGIMYQRLAGASDLENIWVLRSTPSEVTPAKTSYVTNYEIHVYHANKICYVQGFVNMSALNDFYYAFTGMPIPLDNTRFILCSSSGVSGVGRINAQSNAVAVKVPASANFVFNFSYRIA